MHGTKSGGDVAALAEDFAEALVDVVVLEEGRVDEPQFAAEKLRGVGMQFRAALLRVEKHAHEATRVVAKNAWRGVQKLALHEAEAVHLGGGLLAATGQELGEEGHPHGLRQQREAALHRARDHVDGARVEVVIAHELLEPAGGRAVRVAEAVRDGGLDALGEHVARAVGVVVQFVP